LLRVSCGNQSFGAVIFLLFHGLTFRSDGGYKLVFPAVIIDFRSDYLGSRKDGIQVGVMVTDRFGAKLLVGVGQAQLLSVFGMDKYAG